MSVASHELRHEEGAEVVDLAAMRLRRQLGLRLRRPTAPGDGGGRDDVCDVVPLRSTARADTSDLSDPGPEAA